MRATVTGGCCDCIFPWFTIPDGFYATVAMFGKQMDYTEPETCVELYDFVFFVSLGFKSSSNLQNERNQP